MSGNIEFADGLSVNKPNNKAPDFVKASMTISSQKLIGWLMAKKEETVRLDIKESKGGKYYASVNSWKPSGNAQQQRPQTNTGASFSPQQVAAEITPTNDNPFGF